MVIWETELIDVDILVKKLTLFNGEDIDESNKCLS